MVGGTLKETAEEIDSRGGKGVPVVCDHSKDDQVKAVFDRIKKEQGKLDVLVNNAYSAVNVSTDDSNSFKKDLIPHDSGPGLTFRSMKYKHSTWNTRFTG